jgi:hypothetical protein
MWNLSENIYQNSLQLYRESIIILFALLCCKLLFCFVKKRKTIAYLLVEQHTCIHTYQYYLTLILNISTCLCLCIYADAGIDADVDVDVVMTFPSILYVGDALLLILFKSPILILISMEIFVEPLTIIGISFIIGNTVCQ